MSIKSNRSNSSSASSQVSVSTKRPISARIRDRIDQSNQVDRPMAAGGIAELPPGPPLEHPESTPPPPLSTSTSPISEYLPSQQSGPTPPPQGNGSPASDSSANLDPDAGTEVDQAAQGYDPLLSAAGQNIDSYGETLHGAMAGDPKAQGDLVNSQLGAAMGALSMGSLPSGPNVWKQVNNASGGAMARLWEMFPQATNLEELASMAADAAKTIGSGVKQGDTAHIQNAIRHAARKYADGGSVMAADSPQQIVADAANMAQAAPESTTEAPVGVGVQGGLGNAVAGNVERQGGNQGNTPATTPGVREMNVRSPDGTIGTVPSESYEEALRSGYQPVSQAELAEDEASRKPYDIGEAAVTAAEGAAETATFGLSRYAETSGGLTTPEEIEGRAEAHPYAHAAGSFGGLLIPGAPEAKLLSEAGELGARAVGLGNAAGSLAKIGSTSVKMAIEGALMEGGDQIAQTAVGRPPESATSVIADMGLAGVLAGGIGGFGKGGAELWKATAGKKVGGLLGKVIDKLGGKSGDVVGDPLSDAAKTLGVNEIPPEVRAMLSDDPAILSAAKGLDQSDTSAAGQGYQKKVRAFRELLADKAAEATGFKVSDIPSEMDRYGSGKAMAESLASEFDSQLDPAIKKFESYKDRYADLGLSPTGMSKEEIADRRSTLTDQLGKIGSQIEKATGKGLTDEAAELQAKMGDITGELDTLKNMQSQVGHMGDAHDQLAKMALERGWTKAPSGEEMTLLNRVQKELPLQKTVGDLGKYITGLYDNTQVKSALMPDTAKAKAGRAIARILRDAQEDALGTAIGSREGEAALDSYKEGRALYAKQSNIKDALNYYVGAPNVKTAAYGKALREYGHMEGEAVLRKLSSVKDANLTDLLQTTFPKTSELLKKSFLEQALSKASSKAPEGSFLSPKVLANEIGKWSPQVRDFVLPRENQGKIDALNKLLDHLDLVNKTYHNYSNTGRTFDKLSSRMGGSALAAAVSILGHAPGAGLVISELSKYMGKDIPDAVRLGMLKFLGSEGSMSPSGFKSAVSWLSSAIKGETMANKAAKAVFIRGAEILPQSAIPTNKDTEQLDAKLKEYQTDPKGLLDVAGEAGHYMPEHAAAMGQITANAVNYLNNLRPKSIKQSPLDANPVPSSTEKAEYQNALKIAQQPLYVLYKIQQGTVTPKDLVHLSSMYPDAYKAINQKLFNAMAEHKSDTDGTVPYKTRLGLSMAMGQPLDSTLTPQSIMAAQPKPQDQAAGEIGSGKPQKGRPKGSGSNKNSLSKLGGMYKTPNQAAEEDKSKMPE